MARRAQIFDWTSPFHIGGRCINREWFDLPMEDLWELFSHHLYFLHHTFSVDILSFVLMSNHFHLIAIAPMGNLSKAIGYFLRETSREITFASHRINMTYGGRFFRSNLMSQHYFLNCYKYVYRNPIKAGLCNHVEDYRWSTLRGLLGFERLIIPVMEDQTLFSDVEGTLNWLNRAPLEKDWESVRNALRRKTFKLAKDKNSRKANRLETDLL